MEGNIKESIYHKLIIIYTNKKRYDWRWVPTYFVFILKRK